MSTHDEKVYREMVGVVSDIEWHLHRWCRSSPPSGFGLLSHMAIPPRTHELGIRMVIGAPSGVERPDPLAFQAVACALRGDRPDGSARARRASLGV